jgi:hypothetical protein
MVSAACLYVCVCVCDHQMVPAVINPFSLVVFPEGMYILQ